VFIWVKSRLQLGVVPAVFSPAKINLFLAVTGRRADGFHDLVSVVAPLDFGDELTVEAGDGFTLECDDPAVPVDGSNLVLKAAAAFAAATGWPVRQAQGGPGGAHFKLTKRIPMGAGLGGGSSNAVAALRALNGLAGGIASEARLAEIAAALGSDCVLFLKNSAVIMRGRGEKVETLAAGGPGNSANHAPDRISGRRVLLFKPSFGIGTASAYGRMAARGTDYLPAVEAERRLQGWLASAAPAEELLFNNMEGVAFEKYVALPLLLMKLYHEHGVVCRMSGSGSACYALLGEHQAAAPLVALIRDQWGVGAFVQEARIAQSSALTG
jgi:4-diphosphocytidyl-2-C-methyl-D-erythritol kinase